MPVLFENSLKNKMSTAGIQPPLREFFTAGLPDSSMSCGFSFFKKREGREDPGLEAGKLKPNHKTAFCGQIKKGPSAVISVKP